MTGNFESDSHALRTGMLLGELMKLGVTVAPDVDDDDDYTDVIMLAFPSGLEVAIRVLPPEEET